MKQIDLTQFDWKELQSIHDNGLSISAICDKIGISRTVMKRAIDNKLIIKKHSNAIPQSDDVKKQISNSLKRAHNEGRHPGWAHINSRLDKLSYPERFFKQVLIERGIYDKYRIEQQISVGKYFLDFAFIGLKLDVEIDGVQHHRDEDSINHDKIRNEFLINKGWKVYRISWSQMSRDKEGQINQFLNYLENIENETSHYYDIEDIVLKRQSKYGTRSQYFTAKKEETDKEQEKYIQLVLDSDIDFSKFGWVGKVAKIINQKPQKVNRWMKRYMSDFYTNNCFKRK